MELLIIIVAVAIAAVLVVVLRKNKKKPSAPPPVIVPSVSDWRPMLGDAVPGPVKRTPKYQIQYSANGFDEVRPKQIEQTVQWLAAQGALHLIDQFNAAANEVAQIPDWIDAAYEKNRNQYLACGGAFAAFINSNDPSTIFVEVVATPMSANGGWAGGLAYPDKKTIRCVIMTTGNLKENPATADLRLFKNYAPWEIGNCLMFRYGFVPKRIPEDEWGDGVPCK